jgi:hypothetical protein
MCVEKSCYQALQILLPLTCIGTDVHSTSTGNKQVVCQNDNDHQKAKHGSTDMAANAPSLPASSSFSSLVDLARDRLQKGSLQPRILGLLLQRLEPSPSPGYAGCLVEYLRAVLLESTVIANEGNEKEAEKSIGDPNCPNVNNLTSNGKPVSPFEELTRFIKGCRFPMHTLLHCSHRLREEAAKRDLQYPSLRAHNPLSLNADKLEDEAVRLLTCCVDEDVSECLLSEQVRTGFNRWPYLIVHSIGQS